MRDQMNPTNVQESIRAKDGSARYLYLPAAVAAIGGLLFGFDTAVINGAIVFLRRQFALTDSQTEIGASSLLLGCVFGASLAAFTSDRFGRKKLLLVAAGLFTASSIATALPRNLTEFVIARLIGGIAIGVASTLSPLYIAEISPARKRGLLVSVNQLAIVSGILLSYGVNFGLAGSGPANWRWMFASAAVPSAFFLLALLFVSESPRWLVQSGREAEAEQVLSRIEGRQSAQAEIKAIRAAVAEESGSILDTSFRKPLVIAVLIALFSQFTGINTIIYYGSLVFLEHVPNQTAGTALWANVMIGAINFAATVLGMNLIDRVGRNGYFSDRGLGKHSGPGVRAPDRVFRAYLRCLLRHRHRHRNLGADVRNMSYPNPGTSHVDRDGLSLVRDPACHPHFLVASAITDSAGCISPLCYCLHRRALVCETDSSGNQRPQPRGNRALVAGQQVEVRKQSGLARNLRRVKILALGWRYGRLGANPQ